MEEKVSFKANFKEGLRRKIVNLKRKPQLIPTVALAISLVYFTMAMQSYSDVVNYSLWPGLGVCYFITVLFCILSLISFITSFPRREKPKYKSIGVSVFMVVAQIVCQILIKSFLSQDVAKNVEKYAQTDANKIAALNNLNHCQTVSTVHIVLLAISLVLILGLPVLKKLLMKIDTSIELEVTEVEAIEVSEDE